MVAFNQQWTAVNGAHNGPICSANVQDEGGILQVDRYMTNNLYIEQFSIANDFPFYSGEPQSYIIASTARSGSHMLGHFLRKTGLFGFPLEYINPINLVEWKCRLNSKTASETLRLIKERRTSTNGIFGIKVHYNHLPHIGGAGNLLDNLQNPKVVLLTRRDLIEQAVSYAIATQTGQFISKQKIAGAVNYDFDLIDRCLRSIITDTSAWRYVVACKSLEYCELCYEDLCVDMGKAVDAIAQLLNLKISDSMCSVGPVATFPMRQASKLNDEWVERFKSEVSGHYLYNPGQCLGLLIRSIRSKLREYRSI